jgi:hypothetical protein
LCCINLDGHVIYRYNISGELGGLAVDQQGHVYISGYDSDDIHRLSPDGTLRDIVLSKHDGVDIKNVTCQYHSCPQNIKILHQQNIKIFHLQNIKIFHLQNIKIPHLQNIKIFHLQL